MIKVDMVSAVKVQFKKSIFEDDFVESGMTAWLTDIKWLDHYGCYDLYFDFTEFEDVNAKYFKRVYYPNIHTKGISTTRELFTAKEAGLYEPKYSTFFSVSSDKRDDVLFEKEVMEYLKELPY